MRSESGRSLVEMMGTLAIMGILAIAGIWMYNSAMDKLKANTLINEAQKRAVVVTGQIGFQGRTNPSLGEFSDNTFSGGTFSTDVVTSGLYGQFGIQVSGVSKNVCQNILNSIGEDTPVRRLSPTSNPTAPLPACKENNNFLIVYNNNMSTSASDIGYGATDCACQTLCGRCVNQNGVSTCVEECPGEVSGTCTTDSQCSGECVGCVIPSGQTTGTCQTCQRLAYLESTGTQYINTGIAFTNGNTLNLDVIGSFTDVSTSQVMGIFAGAYFGIYSNHFCVGNLTSNTIEMLADTNSHHFVLSSTIGANKNSTLTIDGTTYTSEPRTVSAGNVFLFNVSTTNTYLNKFKMYSSRLTKNDQLVRDFIPVHAPFQPAGKQNCMFDRVSGQLFCNAATGNDFKTNLNE